MSKVNIPKTITDPFFRYQRELIKIQIQNNNGGVTKLLNIETIAKTLNIQVKDFLSLASTIKANLGINEFTINNMNEYKVGFIVRENNRILYDNDEKVNHNKNVFAHDILTKELKKLNIPHKIKSHLELHNYSY